MNNEPPRLGGQGLPTYTYTLKDHHLIPGVGLMTSTAFFKAHPDLVRDFLRATFRGMNDVATDPEGCYALVVSAFLPRLSPSDKYRAEYRVLPATLPFWKPVDRAYGQCAESRRQALAAQLEKEESDPAYRKWQPSVNRDFHYTPPESP